ncbi:MAG: DNRLRE domain-containing protein, partial [Bacteroidetes bacterium]
MKKLLLASIASFSTVLSAWSQCTYTLQPDAHDGKDASVYSLNCDEPYALETGYCVTKNFGNWQNLHVAGWTWSSSPAIRRSFLEFDLSQFEGKNCQVLKAELVLYAQTNGQDHCGSSSGWHPCKDNSFHINRVTEPWQEHQINWKNQPTISSSSTSESQITIGDSSVNQYHNYTIDITDMANFWMAYPDSNYGVRMSLIDESFYHSVNFASSDHAVAALHPKLVLTMSCGQETFCSNLLQGRIFDDLDQSCSDSDGDLG